MSARSNADARPEAIASLLRGVSPAYAPTPLLELPVLAARLGVSRLLAKDEGRRTLGSFKSLGGTYAALRALARATGVDVPTLLAATAGALPDLVCASDGNHGLAVAYAARLAGARARVFLHPGVSAVRKRRIAEQGADIVVAEGTYDDAVAAADAAAREGSALLVADTGDDPDDATVRDVMAGYGVLVAEIREQLAAMEGPRPTHAFVQAGVGGLAAAVAEGLAGELEPPARVVVAEPAAAACVGAALAAGRPVSLTGALDTAAAMLSCGKASAPALAVLLRHAAGAVAVDEAAALAAPRRLAQAGGPATTPSGAMGLAALSTALAAPAMARELELGAASSVLIVISEGDLEAPAG